MVHELGKEDVEICWVPLAEFGACGIIPGGPENAIP